MDTFLDFRTLNLTVGEYRKLMQDVDGELEHRDNLDSQLRYDLETVENELELLMGDMFVLLTNSANTLVAAGEQLADKLRTIRQLDGDLALAQLTIDRLEQEKTNATKINNGYRVFELLNGILMGNALPSHHRCYNAVQHFKDVVNTAPSRIEAIKSVRNELHDEFCLDLGTAKQLVDRFLESMGFRTQREMENYFIRPDLDGQY